ncbi:hypothetical protein C0993_005445 [Termitomyces sp. T159_Od127]|nr:hypothetical protein C0993_005445 [Termitomyces sp. T159_Od127]
MDPPLPADVYSLSDQVLSDRLCFVEEIGFGNWGSVWLCTPKSGSTDGQKIAVKLVHRSKTPTTAARIRSLWNEMKIVRTFKSDPHPSIIPFHSFIITPSYALITMAYLPTLVPVEVAEPKAREWFRSLLSGVDFLHKRGVVHNDIKPANILLSRENVPVLVDFGFAEKYDRKSETAFHSNLSYGTPEYLSPERARGLPHDTRKSDVWSLGVTFFEILVGRTPFEYSEGEQLSTKEDLEQYWSRTATSWKVGWMIVPNADLRCTVTQAMNDPYWAYGKETATAPSAASHRRSSSYTSSLVFEKDVLRLMEAARPKSSAGIDPARKQHTPQAAQVPRARPQPKVPAPKPTPRRRVPTGELSPVKASPPVSPFSRAAGKENIRMFNAVAASTPSRRPFTPLVNRENLSASRVAAPGKSRVLGDSTSRRQNGVAQTPVPVKKRDPVRDRVREWERERERMREMERLEEIEREREEADEREREEEERAAKVVERKERGAVPLTPSSSSGSPVGSFSTAPSVLSSVRQAAEDERVAADARMDRLTIWMRNVEKVVEDARQSFASSSTHELKTLPSLPVAPLSHSQGRTNRSSLRPRSVLPASEVFASDGSFATADASCVATAGAVERGRAAETLGLADRELETPVRKRRATVSDCVPETPAVPGATAGSPSKRSRSHGDFLQLHIAPISMLDAELSKAKVPTPPPSAHRLSDVLDSRLFIAPPLSPREEDQGTETCVRDVSLVAGAGSYDDLEASPLHVEPYAPRRASVRIPAPDSPTQRRVEGVYDRLLMATSGVKRLGRGYQSDCAGAGAGAASGIPVYRAVTEKRLLQSGRRQMPPAVSSEDGPVLVDEMGVLGRGRVRGGHAVIREDGKTTVALVRRAFKAMVPGKTPRRL